MKYPISTIIILFSLGLYIGHAFVEREATADIYFFEGTKLGKVRR